MEGVNTGQDRDLAIRGFSLVELMVVVAVIAIIASITVPSYIHSRATANEAAVVGTLKAIATAEMRFKSQGVLDQNNNAAHEYAGLSELSGVADLRGGGNDRVSPPLLSGSLGAVDTAGRVVKHGYYFALYLPDPGGNGLPETAAGLGAVDPDMAENYWTCLAWPARQNASGRVTFFVNQQGEILKTGVARYSGTTNVPAPGAALVGVPANRIDSAQLAVGVVGADGNQWVVVR
ncbi:MAG: DUF2950 family protein [Planctomycetota bacterium]|jgi:prepilin-type N-terminal cleavage/methylation domain-containing protein